MYQREKKLDSLWSHAKAGTTAPLEKCRDWCLSPAPLKSGTADFAHSTKNALRPSLESPSYECPEKLSKHFTSRTRTVPPCFLSFISVFSQVQLRELSYTYVQYIKTEALATASSKVQRNCEKELSFRE